MLEVCVDDQPQHSVELAIQQVDDYFRQDDDEHSREEISLELREGDPIFLFDYRIDHSVTAVVKIGTERTRKIKLFQKLVKLCSANNLTILDLEGECQFSADECDPRWGLCIAKTLTFLPLENNVHELRLHFMNLILPPNVENDLRMPNVFSRFPCLKTLELREISMNVHHLVSLLQNIPKPKNVRQLKFEALDIKIADNDADGLATLSTELRKFSSLETLTLKDHVFDNFLEGKVGLALAASIAHLKKLNSLHMHLEYFSTIESQKVGLAATESMAHLSDLKTLEFSFGRLCQQVTDKISIQMAARFASLEKLERLVLKELWLDPDSEAFAQFCHNITNAPYLRYVSLKTNIDSRSLLSLLRSMETSSNLRSFHVGDLRSCKAQEELGIIKDVVQSLRQHNNYVLKSFDITDRIWYDSDDEEAEINEEINKWKVKMHFYLKLNSEYNRKDLCTGKAITRGKFIDMIPRGIESTDATSVSVIFYLLSSRPDLWLPDTNTTYHDDGKHIMKREATGRILHGTEDHPPTKRIKGPSE